MKNPVSVLIVILTFAMLLAGTAQAQAPVDAAETGAQEVFFERVKALCGARFEGQSVFPEDPGDAFHGQVLVAIIEDCGDTEIRIPFLVGEDRSRTWVLTQTATGLQLKHDHRHADGTPDEVTLYGGTANSPGSELTQAFPADAYTAGLIPEAATNEWFLTVSADGSEITYYLERHKQARFKATLQRVQ